MTLFGNSYLEHLSLGKDLAYPLREDPVTGDFAVATEEQTVIAGMKLVALAAYGEIPHSETVAADLNATLFENTEVAADLVPIRLLQAFTDNFPQLTGISVSVRSGGNALVAAVEAKLRSNGQQLRSTITLGSNQ